MPYFCIHDHPQLPLVRVGLEKRLDAHRKDGFRLRYSLELPEAMSEHADDVVHMIDDVMGRKKRDHGLYQARYEEVRAVYRNLQETAGPEPVRPWHDVLRWTALGLAVTLALAMSVVLPTAAVCWLAVTAVKRQSGLMAMAETAVVWSIFDWRPAINRLIRYWKSK